MEKKEKNEPLAGWVAEVYCLSSWARSKKEEQSWLRVKMEEKNETRNTKKGAKDRASQLASWGKLTGWLELKKKKKEWKGKTKTNVVPGAFKTGRQK